MRTWSSIYREFKESMCIQEDDIEDYRPCGPPYFDYYIKYAIIV